MKKQTCTFIGAALGLLALPATSFAVAIDVYFPPITITEAPVPGGGTYTVTNNTLDSYLVAFGVSNQNSLSMARVGDMLSTFGCQASWCYNASNLNADNWSSAVAYYELDFPVTFQQAFGDFADNVDPGDTSINWYTSADGALGPGETSSNFFYFIDGPLSSMAFGLLEGPSGITTFQNQSVSTVPLPAAAWLFGGAFAGLFGVARRRAI